MLRVNGAHLRGLSVEAAASLFAAAFVPKRLYFSKQYRSVVRNESTVESTDNGAVGSTTEDLASASMGRYIRRRMPGMVSFDLSNLRTGDERGNMDAESRFKALYGELGEDGEVVEEVTDEAELLPSPG